MDQEKIGKFICAMRKRRSMTQEQLGELLGVTNKTVSRWETGRYMPDIDKLQELSAVLGVSINELLAGEQLEEFSGYIKKADENLVAALTRESPFDLQDRVRYFKRKWRREHKARIAFWILVWVGSLAVCIWRKLMAAWILLPILGILLYAYLRNQMMIYVEQRAYLSEEALAQISGKK